MKKRLLITSIVMMLVVAVALSTATYAWFTANTSVKADAVVLTASTMQGDAIMISRSGDNTGLYDHIVLQAAGSDRLYPATPLAATAFNAPASISEDNFQNLLMNGTGAYVGEALTGDAHTNDKSFYKDTFYVYNKGFSAVTLNPTVSIYYDSSDPASVDAAKAVRIAIIEEKGSWTTSLTYAAAELKNIYEYDETAASTTTGYYRATSYDNALTYFADANGTALADQTVVTSTNYSNYFLAATKNTAKNGALGSSTVGSGYGVAGSDPYTQGGVLFGANDYDPIVAAASNTYIANRYTVVVWLEGWDTECTNAMSAGLFRIDLSFVKA